NNTQSNAMQLRTQALHLWEECKSVQEVFDSPRQQTEALHNLHWQPPIQGH
ncbi:hypothetical protein A2U01_0055529, partial [Trifolium medium]|nr:hypothetical protein [Trifolium medium]